MHHIWCNEQNPLLADDGKPDGSCTMCVGLKKDYPQDGKSGDDLMKEHFQNNKKVMR